MPQKRNTKNKKAANPRAPGDELFGFHLQPFLTTTRRDAKKSKTAAEIVLFGAKAKWEDYRKELADLLHPWQLEQLFSDGSKKDREIFFQVSEKGPLCLIKATPKPEKYKSRESKRLFLKPFTRARDLVGSALINEDIRNSASLKLSCISVSPEERLGALVGLEIASYNYRSPNGARLPTIDSSSFDAHEIKEASSLGHSVNFARHLTNLPACELNPPKYADAMAKVFSKYPNVKIEVWDEKRLEKENCQLLLSVGMAAQAQPRLVHISYRPKPSKIAPIAFVGKGVTFDSGGLDIKPASGMRLMKKDMGGSAAVAGTAYWVVQNQIEHPCDFYLAIAENAISGNAFRPGDVIKSRNGLNVEIHNTDAEGRLVLADAIDVAISRLGKNEMPEAVIDVATLTGAMRVALGTELFGFFANEDEFAESILDASHQIGERGWRMPLVNEYEVDLKSNVADMTNAGSTGFAGAITAALFLEKFVKGNTWGHLDLYGWIDKPVGAFAEPGGTGQGVMTLSTFLKNRSKSK